MAVLGKMNLVGAEVLTGSNYILPGEYTVKVVKAEAKETSKGNPQIAITFQNIEKQNIIEFYNLDSTNEFAKSKMMTLLVFLGNDMTKFIGDITTEMLIGKKMNVIVKREFNDYKGQWFSKIKVMQPYKNEDLYIRNEAEIAEMKNEKTRETKQNNNSNFDFNSANEQTNDVVQDFINDNSFDMSDDDLPF